MSQDSTPADVDAISENISRGRRVLLKSAAGLVLTGSLGVLRVGSNALAASTDERGAAVPPWGDPATLVSAIGAGTLAVPSVAESVAAYCSKGFGYIEHWRGRIPADMANFWGVPAMAGRAMAVVGAPGFQRGMIRIVELGRDFQAIPYRTRGWRSLEIHVRAPQDLPAELKGTSFVHRGTGVPGNARDPEGKPLYRAIGFTGPSGETLALTQHVQLDELKISTGRNNIGPLFIQPLDVHPYPPVRDFYYKTLRTKMRMEVDTRGGGDTAPPGQAQQPARTHKMSAVRTTDYCSIEIAEVPENTPARPTAPGCFAPNVAMCTLTTRDLDAVKTAFTQSDVKFTEIRASSCPPFQGSRAIFCLGRSGERLEVIEARNT